jgi:hypothetical protein
MFLVRTPTGPRSVLDRADALPADGIEDADAAE